MAVDHTMDEAEQALEAQALRQHGMADILAQQGQADPQDAHQLELARQAAYRYFQDTGNDFLDLSPAAQKAYITGSEHIPAPEHSSSEEEVLATEAHQASAAYSRGRGWQPESGSLQDRMNHLGEAVMEEQDGPPVFARGGKTEILWGLLENEDDDDYTLGISVQYNGDEPGEVYLDITQQRLLEWQSLQGKGGETRMAMGIVQHLVNLTGEDIAVAIASALGELVNPADAPTETAIGPDDDEATT